MNKEDAIEYLNEFILFKKISNTTEEEAIECFKLAVKALQQQPSEGEKIIKVRKGTLKLRTGRFVVYDVEWVKEHFNTTEAKIYGKPNEDCISRKALIEKLHSKFTDGFDTDKWWNSTAVLNAISELPSVTPQPKTEQETHVKKGHWIKHKYHGKPYFNCSECTYFVSIGYNYCPGCGSYNGGTK